MAEGRMLKRNISTSKKLGALESDSARLLYTWLLPWLDVEGRFSADPEIIKGHIFPKVRNMTPKKIQKLLYELNNIGLIILYIGNDEDCLQLEKFHNYQHVRKDREKESEIPPPTDDSRITPGELQAGSRRTTPQYKINQIKINQDNIGKPNGLPLRPKSEPSDADIGLTKRLIKRIQENNPKAKIPKDLSKWMNACRLMREVDERTPEDIDAMITFSQNDQFWRSNILSMPKLREKFDQLWMKAKRTRYDGIAAFVKNMEEKNG